MIGLVTWTESRPARRVEEAAVLHVRFCRAPLLRRKNTPPAVLRRRASAAAARLQKLGVARAVFPEGFPWVEVFVRRGVLPVETGPLYRALASDWLRSELSARDLSPTGAVVAVCGDRLTGELVRTVTELCLRHRYVLLDAPGGGDLARRLRREYGVSLLLSPPEDRLAAADAALLFSPRPERKNPVVLPLYDGAVPPRPLALSLPPVLEEGLPAGARRDQLCAALLSSGALRPGQLQAEAGEGP